MTGKGGGLYNKTFKDIICWPSAVDIPEKASPTMTSDNDFRSGVQVLFLIILLRVFANLSMYEKTIHVWGWNLS